MTRQANHERLVNLINTVSNRTNRVLTKYTVHDRLHQESKKEQEELGDICAVLQNYLVYEKLRTDHIFRQFNLID